MATTSFTGWAPNTGDNTPTPALIQVLEQTAYEAHISDGGGEITRQFYVQPFSAFKSLLIALRGTFIPNTAIGGGMMRVYPHNDPVFPNYYCMETRVEPFDKTAVCATATTGFTPQAAGGSVITDLTNARAALNVIPTSYDYDATLDMQPSEIAVGRPIYTATASVPPGANPYLSYGSNGALVTATYRPIMTTQGLSAPFTNGGSPGNFDFVDLQYQPQMRREDVGRNLQLLVGEFIDNSYTGQLMKCGGIADNASVAESVAAISVKRLMVPYNPINTIAYLANKINNLTISIGAYNFPIGTLKVMQPEVVQGILPDGQLYWDITLSFEHRVMYGSYYDPGTPTQMFKQGWISWNHYLAYPTLMAPGTAIDTRLPVPTAASAWIFTYPNGTMPMGYYPVGWNDGLFQFWGINRPLWLPDSQVFYPKPWKGTGAQTLAGWIGDLWYCGFQQEIIQ